MDFRTLSIVANDEIYERNPDAEWDYELLSSNNNISENIITKYAHKPWNLMKLSVKSNTKHLFDKYDKKIKDELKEMNDKNKNKNKNKNKKLNNI
jgi:hypothetical protein